MMNALIDHSSSSEDFGHTCTTFSGIGGGDESSHADQSFQLDWDSYADAGYDNQRNNPDFRWTREPPSDHITPPDAQENSRFVGTFTNENDDEFHSLASTEYLSMDEDENSRENTESQHVVVKFPRLAMKLNLDITVSDQNPYTGKLDLICSTEDITSESTGTGRDGKIANCEMWLNGQYLQQQALRNSSSDIDIISSSGVLFPESDNYSSENLQSSSDSKLSCDLIAKSATDKINTESLAARLDHIRKHYRLVDFSGEEESRYLNKQIAESGSTLDRLIEWYNNGCSPSFTSREPDPEVPLEHMNRKTEGGKPNPCMHTYSNVVPDIPVIPKLPSLPPSPWSSRDNLQESRDSISDISATTIRDTSIPLKDSRPSWLTIYRSNTKFERENENQMLDTRCSRERSSSVAPSGQNQQLFGARKPKTAQTILRNHEMVYNDLSDVDEEAKGTNRLDSYSETNFPGCASLQTLIDTSNGDQVNAINNEFCVQPQFDDMKNNSAPILFDSAFGSMLQDVSVETGSLTNILPPSDVPNAADPSERHRECEDMDDSNLSHTEYVVFHPSDKMFLTVNGSSSSNIPQSDSQLSNDVETRPNQYTSPIDPESSVSSSESIDDRSHVSFITEEECAASNFTTAFTLPGIFNDTTVPGATFGYKTATQKQQGCQYDSGQDKKSASFMRYFDNENNDVSPKFGRNNRECSSTRNDIKSNEEKLRELGVSYGLFDDGEDTAGYESYDSDVSEEAVETNQDKTLNGFYSDDTNLTETFEVVPVTLNESVDIQQHPNETLCLTVEENTSRRSSSSSFTIDNIQGSSDSVTKTWKESDTTIPAKPRPTYEVVDSRDAASLCTAIDMEQKLNEHNQTQTFHSEDTLFSFSDEDQVNFLRKFQHYVESLDIAVDTTYSQNHLLALQEDNDDGYFSCFDENKIKECNIQLFLGIRANTSNSHSSDMSQLSDGGDMLDYAARKISERVISDISLDQKQSKETIQNHSESSVQNTPSSHDPINVRSSDGNLELQAEVPTQNSYSKLRITPSEVFTCPYFDDISRLDIFTPSVEDVRECPVSTFSVSSLASRTHSYVIDTLNSDRNAELIAYSRDFYNSVEDEGNTKGKDATECAELLTCVSERDVYPPNDFPSLEHEPEEHSDCDHEIEGNSVFIPTKEHNCDCDIQRKTGLIDEPSRSDRYSYSAKTGTFVQHKDYDADKRDTSKGSIIAAVERESLAQFASLIVKDAISVAHRKFVWSMKDQSQKNGEVTSLRSDALLSHQEVSSSESQCIAQLKTDKMEAKNDKRFRNRSNVDDKSGVLVTGLTDETQRTSSLEYCRTVVASGLSSIAIRQGMNELRLVACKEWQLSRSNSETSPSETTVSETDADVDNYTKYKAKLKELKIKRQRGRCKEKRDQERKTAIPVKQRSLLYQQLTESSSDDTSDDDSSDEDIEECDRKVSDFLRWEIDQTTMKKIENVLDTERILLQAQQAHHLRRLDRYRSIAESSSPSKICTNHNGCVPSSMDMRDRNFWCTMEKAEALRNIDLEFFRCKDLEKTQKYLSVMEDEYMALRKRADSGQKLIFNTSSFTSPYCTDIEDRIKCIMQTEMDVHKSSSGKYIDDFGNSLRRRDIYGYQEQEMFHGCQDQEEIHDFHEWKQIKHDGKCNNEFNLNKDLELLTNTLNRAFDGIQEQIREDFENAAYQAVNNPELLKRNTEGFDHQEGIGLPVKKNCEESVHPEEKDPDDVFADEGLRLARFAAKAFSLDTSREFLVEEYKQLKDNRLGVDLNYFVPEAIKKEAGDLPPLAIPKCSMCKLRKKINKVDKIDGNEKSQSADSDETKTAPSATIKRFGGHEYDVVTGCGIRKHKVSCALCATRKDVTV